MLRKLYFFSCTLEAYDRNQNFGKTVEVLPEFHMDVPDRSSYRDVHSESDVPRISEQNLKNYLHGFDSELKDEAINMYREKFLIYVRHALSGELCFIHSKCHAEMKKGVAYSIDVSLDNHGIIVLCRVASICIFY